MKELELKERSSKSLLANVLDIEDDFRHQGLNSSQTAIGPKYVLCPNISTTTDDKSPTTTQN